MHAGKSLPTGMTTGTDDSMMYGGEMPGRHIHYVHHELSKILWFILFNRSIYYVKLLPVKTHYSFHISTSDGIYREIPQFDHRWYSIIFPFSTTQNTTWMVFSEWRRLVVLRTINTTISCAAAFLWYMVYVTRKEITKY